MKFGMKRNEAGFSLVELMIVVGIIGILASLAMPKMQIFMAKARQSEAKGLLSNVYALQQSYYTENSQYAAMADIAQIGYVASTDAKRMYDITAMTGGASLSATADLRDGTNKPLCAGVTSDPWTVNELGTLSGSAPACQ
jgi:type IV pilus assembly protein PilA